MILRRGASGHLVLRTWRLRPSIARYTVLILAVLGIALLSITFANAAVAGELDKATYFDIDAKTLDKALLEFGAQAHVQVMFEWNSTTAKLRTGELKGRYTVRGALAALLKGTQLKYIAYKTTVEILPDTSRPSHAATDPSSKATHVSPRSAVHAVDPAKGKASDPPVSHPNQKADGLREVVITGSRLQTTSKESPQEVQIYNRDQIDQSGQTSISGFLSTLPSVSVTVPEVSRGVTSVRLRGLPLGTTLVLINGRRVEGSGTTAQGQYFDLSNIPIDAVQRIEVVENGSSAVYGSDAIAGIVNIILRKDFNGFSADARYDWAKDIRNVRSTLAIGREWDRGGFSLVGSYETDGGLLRSERSLSASNDYRSYGGPDNNYPDCLAANVFSPTRQALPGAPAGSTATYAAVTGSTMSGKPTFSQFTYGSLNECALTTGSLIPVTRRGAALTQAHQQVSPNVSVFAELMYSHLDRTYAAGYDYLFGTSAVQQYSVSAANPFNPFGIKVGVSEQLGDVPITEAINTDFVRPVLGLRGAVGEFWQWELSAWQSTDWTKDLAANEFPNAATIQSALNSSDAGAALNPFVTGPSGSPALLHSLYATESIESMGSDQAAEAFIRGPIMQLPAGPLRAVLGGDYVRSTLHLDTGGGTGAFASYDKISTYHRRYYAVFGEVGIPLIARGSADSPSLLDITASGRHDQYSDFGGDSTGQIGIEIRPDTALLLRGTYGSAFSAPALILLYGPASTVDAVLKDPVTGRSQLAQVVAGGNPSLLPMTGRSHTVGVVYSNGLIPGLVLEVTQWNVSETNVTQSLAPQVILTNESAFPDRVIRNSGGAVVEVLNTEVNFGSINAGGIDYHIGYGHGVKRGTASIDVGATETYHYRQALVPGAQPIESVSLAEDDTNWAPRWKGTVGIGWAEGPVNTHIDGRYTSSYQDYDWSRKIGNFWMVDANIRWTCGESLGVESRYLTGTYVEAGATNLLNRGPQFSKYGASFIGYDAAQVSIIGRSIYVRVGVRW